MGPNFPIASSKGPKFSIAPMRAPYSIITSRRKRTSNFPSRHQRAQFLIALSRGPDFSIVSSRQKGRPQFPHCVIKGTPISPLRHQGHAPQLNNKGECTDNCNTKMQFSVCVCECVCVCGGGGLRNKVLRGARRVHCPWAPNILAIRHCLHYASCYPGML